MQIEDCLVLRGKRPVEGVGEHRLAPAAVLGFTRLKGLCAAELIEVCHLHHLPFYQLHYRLFLTSLYPFLLLLYTLQKPREFPPAAADAALDGALGDAKNLCYLLVIHIFQIAQNDGFA